MKRETTSKLTNFLFVKLNPLILSTKSVEFGKVSKEQEPLESKSGEKLEVKSSCTLDQKLVRVLR